MVLMSTCGAGSSPALSSIFERRQHRAAVVPFDPRVELGDQHVRAPEGDLEGGVDRAARGDARARPGREVAFGSTTLIPLTPHSSSALGLTVESLWVLFSGVAANFQLSPKLLGVTPGGSFQVVGSCGLPAGPV